LHTLIDFTGARWQEGRLGVFNPLARPHMARRIWRAIRSLEGAWDVVHYHGHNPLLGTLVPASWNFLHTLHDQGAECIAKTRFRRGQVCTETTPEACAGCATARPNPMQSWLTVQAVNGLRKGSLAAFQRHRAVFVSDFVRRRYCEVLGVAPNDVGADVVHNFLDAHKLHAALAAPLPDWPVADGRQRVFTAGRIDAAKGFTLFLDALDDALLQRIDLVVAGDGPDLAALRERHAARGVRFLGWCAPADVLAWTRAAHVCVVPSAWEEPCATTVLEALALGRPVLALRRGGTPELSRYGEPGQLRLFDDHAALVQALHHGCFTPSRGSERAGVEHRLPELLALYRNPLPSVATIEVLR